MPRTILIRQRLLLLFLAGLLLLFSPLILPFETVGQRLGIPVLLIYLFAVWAAIIGVAARILSQHRD